MPTLAETMIAAAEERAVVAIPGSPLQFKIRPITSRLILEAGGVGLLATSIPGAGSPIIDIRAALHSADSSTAAICAGVVEARLPDGEWEPFRFVMDPCQQIPAQNRLHVSFLGLPAQRLLAARILGHSGLNEEASVWLERFHPRDAADAGEALPADGEGADGGAGDEPA